VERAVYRTDASHITEIVFNPFNSPYEKHMKDASLEKKTGPVDVQPTGLTSLHLKEAVKNLEIKLLKRSLETSKYNQKKAAKKLGLTYDQLRGLLKKHATALKDTLT